MIGKIIIIILLLGFIPWAISNFPDNIVVQWAVALIGFIGIGYTALYDKVKDFTDKKK